MFTEILQFIPRLFALVCLGSALWLIEGSWPRVRAKNNYARSMRSNLVLAAITIALNTAFAVLFADTATRLAGPNVGLLHQFAWPAWFEAILAIFFLDLFAYAAHRLLHILPAGWRIHRVHHSDTHVDISTALRQHPLEAGWRYLFQFAGIVCIAPSATAVAAYAALSGGNALLEHANLKLPGSADRWLRLVFVTPDVHKNHHSPDQIYTDSNYANLFALWDRLFLTYSAPLATPELEYGLEGFDQKNSGSVSDLLKLPFRNIPKSD